MVPVSKLFSSVTETRDTKVPKVSGMVPLSSFVCASSDVRLLKLPIDNGSVPDNILELILIETTLEKFADPGTPPQVMPSKEHQSGWVLKKLRRVDSIMAST